MAQMRQEMRETRQESRATRFWVIGTVIAVGIGVAAIIMTDNVNILSAMQATAAVIQGRAASSAGPGQPAH